MGGTGWINGPAPHARELACVYCDELFSTAASLRSHTLITHRDQVTLEERERLHSLVSEEIENDRRDPLVRAMPHADPVAK